MKLELIIGISAAAIVFTGILGAKERLKARDTGTPEMHSF